MAKAMTKTDWHNLANTLSFESKGGFINGQFINFSGREIVSINPATEEILCTLKTATANDVDIAVQAARRAFDEGRWPRMAPQQRASILLKLADLIEQHSEQFALIDSLDMGKPITDCIGFDVPSAVATFRHAATSLDKRYDEIAPTAEDVQVNITREPLGVIAAIVPWNYPLLMTTWKIAPALAVGNAVILKPSEKSPLSAMLLARLMAEAGVPDGIFQVVQGYGEEVGKALGLHRQVDCIAFTGSSKVAGLLQGYAGCSNLKRVWLEAGGKGPNVVFEDADLQQAAKISATAIFSNQGEVCIAASRLYLQEKIATAFFDLFNKERETFIPGDPLDPATKIGPLVDAQHQVKVLEFIQKAKEQGLTMQAGGEAVKVSGKGYFVLPTVFDKVPQSATIMRDEIFGPVLSVGRFSTEQEAIQLANDTHYGLGASVWTKDLRRAHVVSRKIRSGLVWVNTWGEGDETTPFGGFKASGNGRDKSMHSLDKYTDIKMTWMRLAH